MNGLPRTSRASSAAPQAGAHSRRNSNLTFTVGDANGREWVLRRPPLGEILPTAHDMAREYRILSALRPTPGAGP